MDIEKRLLEAGFVLPAAPTSVANYIGAIEDGELLVVSGQLPTEAGKIVYAGRVGRDIEPFGAQRAAELCALNILGQAKSVLGELSRIRRCLRIGGFVNCDEKFEQHPLVINGASDLMVLALGDNGRHSRAAVGCSSLPLGACVEVEAMFSIAPRQSKA